MVSLLLDMVTAEICLHGLILNLINDKQESQLQCLYISGHKSQTTLGMQK